MSAPRDWTPVCGVDEIPRLGARRVARAQGLPVALFRTAADVVHALLDRCPHRGGPLSQGIVLGDGVACPLHDWTIRFGDGCAKAPDQGSTPVFACRVDAGRVYLSRGELDALAVDPDPPRAGPCVAAGG